MLADPLLHVGLEELARYPAASDVLIEVGGNETAVLKALAEAGFEDMSSWHWLGVLFSQPAVKSRETGRLNLDNVTV